MPEFVSEPTTPNDATAIVQSNPLTLRVVAANHLSSYPLPACGRLTVGRGPDASIQIDDPSVSRVHAVLTVGPQVTIEDAGSRNGTCVGGRRLEAGACSPVFVGEVVELGQVALMLVAARSRDLAVRRLCSTRDFEALLEHELTSSSRWPFYVAYLHVEGTLPDTGVQGVLMDSLGPTLPVASYAPHQYTIVAQSQAHLRERIAIAETQLSAWGARVHHRIVACEREFGRPPESLVTPSLVYRLADQVAASDLSVLIVGAPGAGHEALAERIHDSSPRREQMFQRVNCAALAEVLLENALFGRERPSASGTPRPASPGIIEAAAGGTVFLDEVAAMPMALQDKLLRAIDARRVTRVGGMHPVSIDVRFISATARDLEREVGRGTFRADLYQRLNGVTLALSPQGEVR